MVIIWNCQVDELK